MEEKKVQETSSAEVNAEKTQEAPKEQETADKKTPEKAETKPEEKKPEEKKPEETPRKPLTFAERMVAYRASHCLTQKQMGELMHLSTNHIGVLERGLKKPRPATKAKFYELSGKREIRTLGDSRPMSQKEADVYQEIWESLSNLSVRRRIEVLSVFKYILKWFA